MKSSNKNSYYKITFIALALLVWDLWCYPWAIPGLLETAFEPDGKLVNFLYISFSIAAYFAIAIIFSGRKFTAIFFLFILASHLIAQSFAVLTFSEFTVNDFEIMLHAYANKFQALRFYESNLKGPLLLTLMFYTAIIIFSRFIGAKGEYGKNLELKAIALVGVIIFLFALLDNRVRKTLPGALQVASSAIEYYMLPYYTGKRAAVEAAPEGTKYPLHIIMIMDESIRGDYLEVNGYKYETTPFIATLGQMFRNYGIAVSNTNLTYTSNYSVFTGLKENEFPDYAQRSRRNPSIFQFAEKAGRRVNVLFSAMHLSDYQDWTEVFSYGNYNVQMVKSYPAYEVDRNFIDVLDEITISSEPTFTWINKSGCHFPYAENYPVDMFDSWWQRNGADPSKDKEEYAMCVRWRVDHFMAELYGRLGGREVIILYSSDHGDSLDLKYARLSHGQVKNPPSEQASIPLMLFSLNDQTAMTIQDNFKSSNVNRMHASQIFPTLLHLFGYKDDVLKKYDPSIFEVGRARSTARRFLSGMLWGHGKTYMSEFKNTSIER